MKTFLGSVLVLIAVIGCVMVYNTMGSLNACQNAGVAYADEIARTGGNLKNDSLNKMNQECAAARANGKILESVIAPNK